MSRSSTSSSDESARAVDSDSLVVVPEDTDAPRSRRLTAWTLVLAFLALIVGTGAIDSIWPAPRPRLEGREKLVDERLRTNAHWLDGSRASWIEHEIKLRSRVRETLAPPYALALFEGFGEVDPQLLVGRDHWLFLKSRSRPPPIETELLAARAAKRLAALDRRLGALGVRMLVVPVPRKEVICAKFLPPNTDARPDIEPSFTRALTSSGVENIDLLPAFEAEDPAAIYFKYGTHWTDRAQLITAEMIAKQLGMWIAPAERKTEIRVVGAPAYEGDLINILGADAKCVQLFLGDGGCEALAVYRNDRLLRQPEGESKGLERIVIAGTSFTANRNLPLFLQHFAGQRVINAGRPGVDPSDAIRDRLLSESERHWPQILLVEIPLHSVFSTDPFPGNPELFAQLPIGPTTQLLYDDRIRIPTELTGGALELDQQWKSIALVAAGFLAHTGEGSTAVKLSAKTTGDVLVQLRHAGSSFVFEWSASRPQMLLPLISPQPTSEPITLVARAKGNTKASIEVERVEVCALGDAQSGWLLDCAAPQGNAAEWTQELTSHKPDPLQRMSLLWIDVGVKKQLEGTLEITAQFEDGPPVVCRFSALALRAWIVIDLGSATGRRLTSVLLKGTGATPPKAAVQARVFSCFEPTVTKPRKNK
jgi:hypothetical protein